LAASEKDCLDERAQVLNAALPSRLRTHLDQRLERLGVLGVSELQQAEEANCKEARVEVLTAGGLLRNLGERLLNLERGGVGLMKWKGLGEKTWLVREG